MASGDSPEREAVPDGTARRAFLAVRRILFWVHLAAGVAGGVVILVMSVTGTLLAFEKQVVSFAERGVRVTPRGNDAELSPEAVLRSASASGETPAAVTFAADRARPAQVSFRSGRVALL